MIKAYNTTWIRNLHVQREAAGWRDKNLLSGEQYEKVVALFPSEFHNPGIFVKIGLFIFGVFGCTFLGTFIAAFFSGSSWSDQVMAVISLVCCAIYLVVLEIVIRDRKAYHSGIDNALLYSTWIAAMIPVFLLLEADKPAIYCAIALVVTIPFVIRYADLLAAASAFVFAFALLFLLLVEFPLGKAILSFVFMAASAIVYFLVKKIRDIYYLNCRRTIEVLSLLVFYLSGNYLVVREGNAMLSEVTLKISPEIPLSGLFYFFTIGIPFAYIFFGLKMRDRLLLTVGLVAAACSFYTFRHYFSALTPAQELTLAGAILISLAGLLVRFLRSPKMGISDEPAAQRRFADLQAIVAAQVIDQPGGAEGVRFGGGNFGGGGAGESY